MVIIKLKIILLMYGTLYLSVEKPIEITYNKVIL